MKKRAAFIAAAIGLGACAGSHSTHAPADGGAGDLAHAPAGACAALPKAGIWDATSISPVTSTDPGNALDFTGKSMAVVVDPLDSSSVWLGTGNKGLFKSSDCGATWTHVNSGTNGAALDQGALWSMAVDPVHQGTIYTVAGYGSLGLWKSTDGGVDWVQLVPATSAFGMLMSGINSFVNNVSLEAANPAHIVAMSHGPCSAPYTNGCIGESFDGGATWSNTVAMPAAWGEKGGVQIIDATTWIWGGGSGTSGLYVTTDNGKSWTSALAGGTGDANGELAILPLARAADGAFYISSLEGVLRSTDGVAWSVAWGPKSFANALDTGIVVTASTIYAADGVSFYSAPLGDYGNWSTMAGPPALTADDSAQFLAYDSAHHLLYASTWGGGVFRIVTP